MSEFCASTISLTKMSLNVWKRLLLSNHSLWLMMACISTSAGYSLNWGSYLKNGCSVKAFLSAGKKVASPLSQVDCNGTTLIEFKSTGGHQERNIVLGIELYAIF